MASTEKKPSPSRPRSASAQSQWALVWREFRRRRLAVASGLLILLLVTISIFASFLANDQPICYRGINRFDYEEGSRTLTAVIGLLATEFTRKDGPSPEKVAEHQDVLRRQSALLADMLPPDQAEGLLATLQPALELTPENQADAAESLRNTRIELRRRFSAANVTLNSSWHYPVIASLTTLDIAFIVLNILVLLVPVWRPPLKRAFRDSPPGRAAWFTLAILTAIPCACAVAWWGFVPERVDRTNYKAGVLAGSDGAEKAPVVYEAVLWPVIPYGLDEDNLDAKYAKPEFGGGHVEQDDTAKSSRATPWDGPHWLGTDGIGRDVLCRMIWGGRVSLAVGIVAVSIYVTIGIIVGAVAGYFRGVTDMIISRIIEIVICFPSFFLILTIVAFVGPSIFNIMIVIGLTGWTGVARLVRGEFLRLGEQEFVLAGRALGYSAARIIFRHVLPNAMAPVLVSATFGIAGAILTESALSFLGFGITVPTPSWGGILATGRNAIFRARWLIYFPGLAIFITITAYNLVGEAFRDAADPRLRGQFKR